MDAERLGDLFEALGPLRVKRMFGGLGVWRADRMFALVADGVLFLKTDRPFRAALADDGSTPFCYDRKDGRRVVTSYWRLPDAALDDPDLAASLGRRALSCAEAGAR